MDQTIDLSQRVNEYAVAAARTYVASQLARPGATGRSPDGTVTVTVNGLGDVTDVRVEADDLPAETAARLAGSVKAAWTAAARSHARAEADDSPVARQPGFAEFLDEQIDERYGPPRQEAPTRRVPRDDEEDFSQYGIMR